MRLSALGSRKDRDGCVFRKAESAPGLTNHGITQEHDSTRASSTVRAGCREPNPRLRRREKNVLDIPYIDQGITRNIKRRPLLR
jgi:hypothetical protein